jgi:hypothetical protein
LTRKAQKRQKKFSAFELKVGISKMREAFSLELIHSTVLTKLGSSNGHST